MKTHKLRSPLAPLKMACLVCGDLGRVLVSWQRVELASHEPDGTVVLPAESHNGIGNFQRPIAFVCRVDGNETWDEGGATL